MDTFVQTNMHIYMLLKLHNSFHKYTYNVHEIDHAHIYIL